MNKKIGEVVFGGSASFMKKQNLLIVASLFLMLNAGCPGKDNNSNTAAVPQACGPGAIPNSNCTAYNPQVNTNGYCAGVPDAQYGQYAQGQYPSQYPAQYPAQYGQYPGQVPQQPVAGQTAAQVPNGQNYGWGNQQPCYPSGINSGCPFGMQAIPSGFANANPNTGAYGYGNQSGYGYSAGYSAGYGNGYNGAYNGAYNGGYPGGAQPYIQQNFICVQSSYLQTAYAGYYPYYPSNYAWGGGVSGYGPVQGCDPYRGSAQCGAAQGLICQPPFGGARYGICVFAQARY